MKKDKRTDRCAVDGAARRTWQESRDTAVTAMTTGVYGAFEEWKRILKSGQPKAIMHITHVNGKPHVEPANWGRYHDCKLVTGVAPDTNPLWNVLAWNFVQQCRDDELHHMRLGMMPHVVAAAMTKITLVLHPEWARDKPGWPGASGMRGIWRRLGANYQRSGTCTPWVCAAFERGFGSREFGTAFKFGVTGNESERLFLLLPQCLQGLIEPELAKLRALARADRAVQPEDPLPAITHVLCRLIGWYMSTKMQVVTDKQIDQQHREAGDILELLEATFPVRSARVPSKLEQAQHKAGKRALDSSDDDGGADAPPVARPHQPHLRRGRRQPSCARGSKSRGVDTDAASSDSDAARDHLSDDDSDEDLFRAADHGAAAGGAAPQHCLRLAFSKWAFPKAHAMLHIRETLRLYGCLSAVAAESMERMHLKLKKWFKKVKPGPSAQLQVLLGVIKEEQASRIGPTCLARRKVLSRAPVNASFGDCLHRSGREFAVWLAIQGWRRCRHELTSPGEMVFQDTARGSASQKKMIISLHELLTPSSYWCEEVPALQHVPLHLALYIQHKYPRLLPSAQVGRLSPSEIRTLLNAVHPWLPGRKNQHSDTDAHLCVFNALSIKHPDIGDDDAAPAQVLSQTMACCVYQSDCCSGELWDVLYGCDR